MRNASDREMFMVTVMGEPASKSNTRSIVKMGDKLRVIKSKKALNYLKSFALQCPVRQELLEGDLAVGMRIFYRTRRPDLDESLILDALQNHAYKNDRQVKAKYILHGLDKENPRTLIVVSNIGNLSEVVSIINSSGR